MLLKQNRAWSRWTCLQNSHTMETSSIYCIKRKDGPTEHNFC